MEFINLVYTVKNNTLNNCDFLINNIAGDYSVIMTITHSVIDYDSSQYY